jgi:hypothetical protein
VARKSSIDKLSPEFKAELERLIRDGAFTIDEMLEHMQDLGAPLKRSAIGDYTKRMNEQLADYRKASEVAGVWVKDLGENPESKTGQLLGQMLQTLAFNTLSGMAGSEGIDPKSLSLIARSLKDMAGAQAADLAYRGKVRAEYKAELAERAAAAADTVKTTVRSAGLSEELANQIRATVLGVVG